ncbi:hypothetical protein WJR50_05215 [Catalinimonas sp. 4WD22]|uniref:hypothetical protein n=1 Tax=Catalinimonas locisalis TaxID=3133978 RepID=UPI00310139F2
MRATLSILILAVLYACNNEPDPLMLQKKWKIKDAISSAHGSYWLAETEILDFTDLSTPDEQNSSMYLFQTEEKQLIIFKDSDAYFEVLRLTEDTLEVGLYLNKAVTKEGVMVMLLKCNSVD